MLQRPTARFIAIALGCMAFSIFFVGPLCPANGALIASTTHQDGHKLFLGSGAASKVGTFVFPRGYSAYTQVLFRSWVDLAGTTLGQATPTLVFAAYHPEDPDHSFLLGPTVATSVWVTNNSDPVTFGLDERIVGYVPLKTLQGTAIANLVNSDPLGRIDAWLYSPSLTDFATPDSIEFLQQEGNGWVIRRIELTSTISFAAVPEPSTVFVFGGLIFGSVAMIRTRGKRS